jgi:hypothetical protein
MTTEPTPQRPARAPRRWLYVVGGVAIALVAALVIVLVTDDSSDSTPAAEDTTTTATPASTTAPAATTTGAPVTPTTAPLPPLENDPQRYATYLFAAWQNGDQTAAAKVASPDAVQQLFAEPYQAGWTFGTCNPATGSVYCTWSMGGTRLTMTVRNLTGGLPIQVLEVERAAG